MREYPSTNAWEHANDQQRQRAERSFRQLKKHNAPVYPGPLFVDGDEEVELQSAQDVARRTLVLWAIELRAEGMPQDEAIGLIKQLELWDSVSPDEKQFLEDDDPDPDECEQLVWRLESIWVLLWSLGYIDELDWPRGMCDVSQIVEILKHNESNPGIHHQCKVTRRIGNPRRSRPNHENSLGSPRRLCKSRWHDSRRP